MRVLPLTSRKNAARTPLSADSTDFEYELQIAQLNRVMDTSIDTVFLTTSLEYAYLSSSTVKEVAAYGGDISNFVTPYVADEVHKRLRERQGSQA